MDFLRSTHGSNNLFLSLFFVFFEITVIPRVHTHGVWIAPKKPLDSIPYHPGYESLVSNNDPSKGLFCGVWLLPWSRDEANFTVNVSFHAPQNQCIKSLFWIYG